MRLSLIFKVSNKHPIITITNISLSAKNRSQTAEKLADSYTLYLQTYNFYWNVTKWHFRQ
jgi:DNA-binding ferritin-like protein